MVPDPFIGNRVHAWVLLKKGKRGVAETVFLEPSTGRSYSLVDSPYEAVDSVFNHLNFYINMNQEMSVKDINFTNMGISGKDWEFVMIDIPTHDLVDENEQEEDKHEEDGQMNPTGEEFGDLDMPPSW
jgi:hypothetical protein